MIKKKKCYRVQVGPWKDGLLSNCMPKKEAEALKHFIYNGWVSPEVITDVEAKKRRKRFG